MKHADAAKVRLPESFGREYGGQTIGDIAITDEGLLWLDRLRGRVRAPWLADALAAYLDDPTIAAEVSRALETRS